MENKQTIQHLFLGLTIMIGLLFLGFFIYNGLKTFSDKDRVVTVKGLAELGVKATSAIISVNFSFSGDNLQSALVQTKNKQTTIINYLSSIGYKQVTIENVGVMDRQKYYETQWENEKQVKVKIDRYTVTQQVAFQSIDIEKTEDVAAQIKLDLISKDLTSNINTQYIFPNLNAIKPKLIAESTKNARIAGEQFANDSQATLGKIKTASQGQITIAGSFSYNEDGGNSNSNYPYIQKVRVVSTIEFFLL